MASPFRVFRKHEKLLLVTAGLVAIFVFVIGDAIMSLVGSGGGAKRTNPVVATWNGGELKESEVQSATMMRNIARNFLGEAAQKGYNVTLTQPKVGILQNLIFPQQEIDRDSTILIRLLADKAREQGFVVDNEAINHYLTQLTQGKVSNPELGEILRKYNAGRRVSHEMLFESLRTEMLAVQFVSAYLRGGGTLTPAQLWGPWKNLNDLITVETMAVPVDDLVENVEEPTDEQLRQFYEEHKDRVDRPVQIAGRNVESPTPGFMTPAKVRLQYLVGDFDAFVDRIREEITDKEVKDYYEANKEQFVLTELARPADAPPENGLGQGDALPPAPEPGATGGSPLHPEGKAPGKTPDEGAVNLDDLFGTPPAEEESAGEKSGKKSGENAEEKSAKKKTEDAADSGPGASVKTVKKPSSEQSTDEKPSDEKPKSSEKNASETNKQPAMIRLDAVQFIALQEEDLGPDPDAQPPAPRPDDPPEKAADANEPAKPAGEAADSAPNQDAPAKTPMAETPSSQAPSAATPPAETQPSNHEKPAPDAPFAGSDKQGEATGDDLFGAGHGGAKSAAGEVPTLSDLDKPLDAKKLEKKYMTLEQAADEIRTELARQRAGDRITEAMKEPVRKMRRYFNDISEWEFEHAKDPNAAGRPKSPSLKDLAEKNGLYFEETELITYWDLQETPVGESKLAEAQVALADYVFGDKRLKNYQPIQTHDYRPVFKDGMIDRIQSTGYLVWRIEKTEAKEHKLEDIREKVARAWKQFKARELAKEKAKEYAKQATEQGGSLSDVFAGRVDLAKVNDSGPFSWLTLGAVSPQGQTQVRQSEVYGAEGAGPDFMEKVFSLEPGDVDVAMNHPQTIAYVVRLVSHEKPLRELRAEFMESFLAGSSSRELYQGVQQNQRLGMRDILFRYLEQESGLEIKEPEELAVSEE